jgi:hypothetical protein
MDIEAGGQMAVDKEGGAEGAGTAETGGDEDMVDTADDGHVTSLEAASYGEGQAEDEEAEDDDREVESPAESEDKVEEGASDDENKTERERSRSSMRSSLC